MLAAAEAAPRESAAAPQKPTFKAEEIEQLAAPIALYPDPLLAQVLMASTYPLEVVEAARWQKQNSTLKDKALEDALQQQTWDPSVKSLTAFPPVLTMLNDKRCPTDPAGGVGSSCGTGEGAEELNIEPTAWRLLDPVGLHATERQARTSHGVSLDSRSSFWRPEKPPGAASA